MPSPKELLESLPEWAREELQDQRRGATYWRAMAERFEEALKEFGWVSDQ